MVEPVEIYLLNKKVRLLQPEKGFRPGLDSVMLAASCPVQAGQSVLDMGCGVGGAAFCLLYRVPKIHLTGVDVQEDYIALAERNVSLNEADSRAEFVCSDICDFKAEERFDHIICNPPFLESGQHIASPDEGLAVARGHNEELSLKDWIDAGFHNLKPGGSLSMIHRADSIDRIIRGMGKRFGAIEIIPLWPKVGMKSKRVIVRALKDRKTPASIHAGLVLHETDGEYTSAADKVLRDAEPLV